MKQGSTRCLLLLIPVPCLWTKSLSIGFGFLFLKIGTTLPALATPYGNRERVEVQAPLSPSLKHLWFKVLGQVP